MAGVQQRRRQRWMALAACVAVLAVGAVLALGGLTGRQRAVVAQVEAGAQDIVAGERFDVPAGSKGLVLRTQPGGIALRVAGGSAVQFETPDRLRLLAGSVYVDTGEGEASSQSPFIVLADQVSIAHVGTQFLVRFAERNVDVAVRSGAVAMRTAGDSATLRRGQLGHVAAGEAGAASVIERREFAVSGEAWSWVDELSPPLAIEGLSLYEALVRLAREAGLELQFESAQAETAARETLLHGPALNLPPERVLQAVLVTTNFSGEIGSQGAVLTIRMR
jgi:ferric-dicitrate binding protein FerR (iron transport regulator)